MSVSELEPYHITYLLKGSDLLKINEEVMNDLMLQQIKQVAKW